MAQVPAYVCVHVYICVCVCVCICVCVSLRRPWPRYLHMCVCIHKYVCVYVYMCVCKPSPPMAQVHTFPSKYLIVKQSCANSI